MIDRPALIAWRSKAPWPNPVQVEQDLLLSRLMIEIASDEVLGPELVMKQVIGTVGREVDLSWTRARSLPARARSRSCRIGMRWW